MKSLGLSSNTLPIEPSELILRDDGSIYHLNLKPEQVADKIIVVGDPNRVALVSSRFERIDHKVSGREFNTHTGIYKGERISVISTGIGVDNIDIVINELDAVVNIDLNTKMIKPEKKRLEIVRLGTSGSLQEDIPTGAFIVSEYAIGMDGVLNFYKTDYENDEEDLINAFHDQIDYPEILPKPYIVRGSRSLFEKLKPGNYSGITATASGFYGPQGRKLRLQTVFEKQNEELGKFNYNGKRITNFEMETSSLYGLSSLLGHEACTVCAIIANRYRKEFCEKPTEVISELIDLVLERLTT